MFLIDRFMTRTLTWRGGSLWEVSLLCQRSTISSPDIDWSGKRIHWAVIVKSWSQSSTHATWILSDHRLIGGLPPPNSPHRSMSEYVELRFISTCLPSIGIYTERMLILTGPFSPPSSTTIGKLSKMANSCMSHR